MKEKIKINLFEFEPYCFLEGGTGLNHSEEMVSQIIFNNKLNMWIIDDLYSNPERLLALRYLKPKTIFFGTTGTYKKDLVYLKEIFKITEYIPDNIVFTLGDTECHFWDLIDLVKSINPKVRFFELYTMYTLDDDIQLIPREDI